ncbi:MAG TPA: hypothetical protein VMI10_13925 [Terriglobales bacterium]|nr:hypothetical protein [Terriglobales bacterium]
MWDVNSRSSKLHIPEEDLVGSADGELTSARAASVNAHLEACWECRARMEEIDSTITGFVRAHHAEFDAQLPADNGPRALLRARLAESNSESQTGWWGRVFQFSFPRVAIACLSMIAIAVGVLWLRHSSHGNSLTLSVLSDAGASPNPALTPGATRQITMNEACAVPREEVVRDVSISLKQEVLQEYGLPRARLQDYEIDYLIAPRLGGAEDIRNLWPEPYRAREWSAYAKDALEERLHEMVCSGQLDLSTAQHDIATDWIAAYKKYFHTNRPLPSNS